MADGHDAVQVRPVGPVKLPYVLLPDSGNPRVPTKAHEGDAGWDLYSSRDVTILPRRYYNVPTGIAVAIPTGYFGHMVGRSGHTRDGLLVRPAVIDAGYRGELFVIAFNDTDMDLEVHGGTRICQMVLLPVPDIEWQHVVALTPSMRGTRGFGSSRR